MGETGPPGDFEAWKKTLSKLFPRELEAKLLRLKAEMKRVKSDPTSYKLKLTKEAADWKKYAEKRCLELEKSTDPHERKVREDYLRKLRGLRGRSDCWERESLLPGAAATVANITRKLRELEERLR